ncbi:nucleotidyltransferase domain-containing protein [Streptacidiphilus fuscans]|uniref:Nucleotidyltransferase domain-containing protein n=1 Tax=Streptacidiphilus fuscans TaxID=2789292 RepID=A0A931B226_9ACTN|nr:nucleotidyltransferase domain-containing protein [Streptacidiphilus fuscans]MBF9067516.1 nucleotidyltransferase domain-containing protein [Streptacidiphilus fuscans]
MNATTTGLDSDGYIAREGSLDRVPPAYAPVVAAARERIAAAFDLGSRLHSAYLYGSIPRGTAVPGVSDLDLLLALHEPPGPADWQTADELASSLDAAFPFVNGVGVLLFDVTTLLSELERHDLGWFLACLCTPLLGPDLAAQLPRYRPDSLLARETNGDLALALPHWRERLAATEPDPGVDHDQDLAARRVLCRSVARRLVRSGFTLVMPRWGGWTSDLQLSAQVFARYYPARATQMHLAATVARTPTDDSTVLHTLVDDLAPWLAAEYTAVHGMKAPRPKASGD